MRALVTGCAGFIGSQLTESLLKGGHEVVGVDALIDTYDTDVKLGNLDCAKEFAAFSFVESDLTNARLDPLVEDCEVIFHLAAEPGVRTSWGNDSSPMRGTTSSRRSACSRLRSSSREGASCSHPRRPSTVMPSSFRPLKTCARDRFRRTG